MSISLETAERMLDNAVSAEEAILTGAQEYEYKNRKVTKADLPEIRKSIQYWEKKVREIKGEGGPTTSWGIPM
ncbi:hypothetical protein [Ilyobacter polytropus]|uniref:Uncharacterized protein n=1 Tax=Ilyobacter polytropus (strain ATCC 51220 / DSM 2926 / LMG 16218 / CuHBu1) TaxID=572544 RepID=E3HBM6_ILYPC|nr:hypothetical protein [Ilyobacter polytropus]ADO83722.1 hypothetical protein Ilyop_1951 [Ilyobacter polytropus DSM 2926]